MVFPPVRLPHKGKSTRTGQTTLLRRLSLAILENGRARPSELPRKKALTESLKVPSARTYKPQETCFGLQEKQS
jgi:hypothetical protein